MIKGKLIKCTHSGFWCVRDAKAQFNHFLTEDMELQLKIKDRWQKAKVEESSSPPRINRAVVRGQAIEIEGHEARII